MLLDSSVDARCYQDQDAIHVHYPFKPFRAHIVYSQNNRDMATAYNPVKREVYNVKEAKTL